MGGILSALGMYFSEVNIQYVYLLVQTFTDLEELESTLVFTLRKYSCFHSEKVNKLLKYKSALGSLITSYLMWDSVKCIVQAVVVVAVTIWSLSLRETKGMRF